MKNLLIIRLSSLGDIIHTLPAFSVLRQNFPEARIFWACEKSGREILELVPGLDEIIIWPNNFFRTGLKIRKYKIEVTFDFQGLLKSALLALASGARKRLGFPRQNLKERLASLFYTQTSAPINEFDHHVIYKNLHLLEPVGLKIEWQPENLHFPLSIPNEIRKKVKEKLGATGLLNGRPLIVFNVGASWESKRLPAAFWTEVIKGVRKEFHQDYAFCLLWGNKEELNLARTIQQATDIPVVPFLTIKEVIGLISSSFLVVSGDTFALQAASALRIPVVGLFGPTSPIRNGPIRSHDAVVYASVNCSPCYQHRCSRPRCWESISPQQVTSAIISRIKSYG